MACIKNHKQSDLIVKNLPISQGGFGRHKCASCAYEMGLINGKKKILNFDLESFISGLEESQKVGRRHKSALEAYTLGFFHGLGGANNHSAIKDKLNMASQMRDFGLSMIARGLLNVIYAEITAPFSHAMGVVNIANGFEILIKSKIVEEHPLLVFEQIPKESKIPDGNIKFEDLIEHGKTIMYSELPERLWATTGYKVKDLDLYNEFGKVRNKIIHFSVPKKSLQDFAIRFTFTVVEKAVNDWWDTTILEYVQDLDLGGEAHLEVMEHVKRLDLKINYRLDVDGNFEKIK